MAWRNLTFCCITILIANAAMAHPMGENSISQYLMIRAGKDGLRIGYRMDFAENPTVIQLRELDADHNGTISETEQKAYLDAHGGEWASRISVKIDGKEIALKPTAADLKVSDGVGGRKTLLVMLDYVAAAPVAGQNQAKITVGNYSGIAGWREAAVLASDACWIVDGEKRVKAKVLEQRAELAESGKDWSLTFVYDQDAPPGGR